MNHSTLDILPIVMLCKILFSQDVWNSLPSSVVSSKTIEEFKAQIQIIGTEVCVLACLCTASCK